jgi:transposase
MRLSKQQRSRLIIRKIVEYLLAGKGVNKTARALKKGKKKIRTVREMAKAAGYLDGVPLPAFPEPLFPDEPDGRKAKSSEVNDLLLGQLDWIKQHLDAGWHAITVFEELPVKVRRSSFYRFLERHNLNNKARRPRRVVPEIVHRPGEALLVDWGKVASITDPETGQRRTVWAFVGTLGYSRYLMVRFVLSQDVPTTLSMLEGMLQEIGGVPWRITSDNPECFSLEASRYEPLVNPVYERFASYYGTTIECLPPADPEKKGKVERPMPFVRRLMESFTGDWGNLNAAQAFIDSKLAVANERRHGTTNERPIDRLINVEISALKAMPKVVWQQEEHHEGNVRKDGHIRFRGKYYSVEEKMIGQEVVVIGNRENVWIYHGGKLIETHERLHDPYRSKSTTSHHLKPWERAMNDTSVYRDRARTIGPYVDEMVVRIIGNGLGVIDFRKVWGILSLDKSYPAVEIDEACRQALMLGSLSYRTV